jgi:hypothetical protein
MAIRANSRRELKRFILSREKDPIDLFKTIFMSWIKSSKALRKKIKSF